MQSQHRKFIVRCFLGVLFLSSFTFNLWVGYISSTASARGFDNIAMVESSDVNQLVTRGVELYKNGDVNSAIAQWETARTIIEKRDNREEKAIVLENLARAYQQIGQIDRAIEYWTEVIATYRQLGNQKQVGRMLVEQAQAYSSLGQNKRAIAILCSSSNRETSCTDDSAISITRKAKDLPGYAAALGSLGNAYRLRGEYEKAIEYLKQSLDLAQEINNPTYRAATLNNLANVNSSQALVNYRRAELASTRGASNEAEKFKNQAIAFDIEAIKYFQQSIELSQSESDSYNQVRVLLNAIPVYYRKDNFSVADDYLKQALSLWEKLPDSRDKVYAAIDLTNLLKPVTYLEEISSGNRCLKPEFQPKAKELLQQAISISQRLKDARSLSFALGKLGHLYECRQDYQQALDLTQKARWAADRDLLAKDSLYLWEWQAARIFEAQGKQLEAVNAYEQAVITLESIRKDILSANRDLQFDFRDTINPIYRQLAELKLEQASLPNVDAINRNKVLNSALITIDSLKLAELQNYFGDDCNIVPLNSQNVEAKLSQDTAILSSIILPERTAIILSLPKGEEKLAWIDVDSKTFTKEINEFRKILERYFDPVYDLTQSQKLYNWIVRSFASDLEKAQIKTLVFIHDGILQSIPMAALHDGKKYLVEKYAIATTPSINLTDKTTVNRQKLRALAAGLTEKTIVDGQTFPALGNVAIELQEVKTEIQNSKLLLDDNFTRDSLQQELAKTAYPIVHIATHGKFGTEAKDTFLVTGNNSKITITELDAAFRKIRQSDLVELLVLTACQTAVGDDRAALGLAGVAVQAGVKSAIASLWYIQDAPTVELVAKFYDSYNSGMSKAEALRAAQLEMIKAGGETAHPAYWATFVLVGNWL